MKTAISVPDHVFEAAEEFARRMGLSRSELYSSAVAEYLEVNRSSGVTAQLNQVYSDEDSAISENLMTFQLNSLPQDDW